MSGGNYSNKDPHLVIADAHNWDRSISIKYDLGKLLMMRLEYLEIGQLVQNGGNGYTHGETHFRTNGEKRVSIKSNGYVGIGTTVPKGLLDLYIPDPGNTTSSIGYK